MSEKYIRQNKNSCTIVKGSRTYAKTARLEDAIFIRDFLIANDWDLTATPQIMKKDEDYLVLTVYEDKIHVLSRYRQKPDSATVDRLIKKHKRNPNNSKYGLNITRVFDVYVIKKQIAGDDYIFGYYDNLEDAEFVRNFLMDHNWNVNEFGQIEFDEDARTYRAVKVIDDKVYVLDSFDNPKVKLNEIYEEFLSKISKHAHGLSHYPHLDLLSEKIDDLEEELNVKTKDSYWNLADIRDDPLNDLIFSLTPFQKSVYDAIGDSATFEEVKRKLIRYRSKNFDEKISRNLDELADSGLIEKRDGFYTRVK